MTCLALSTDYSQELSIHQQWQDDFCGLQIKSAVRAPWLIHCVQRRDSRPGVC